MKLQNKSTVSCIYKSKVAGKAKVSGHAYTDKKMQDNVTWGGIKRENSLTRKADNDRPAPTAAAIHSFPEELCSLLWVLDLVCFPRLWFWPSLEHGCSIQQHLLAKNMKLYSDVNLFYFFINDMWWKQKNIRQSFNTDLKCTIKLCRLEVNRNGVKSSNECAC